MSKRAASGEEQAAAIMQMLSMQAELQDLVLKGYTWSFKACTHESSGPVLSQKEIRCIQAGMNNFIEARTHLAQSLGSK